MAGRVVLWVPCACVGGRPSVVLLRGRRRRHACGLCGVVLQEQGVSGLGLVLVLPVLLSLFGWLF